MYNKSVCRTLRDFYQDEQGTYVLLTGVVSFVLIGLIALATDGSGLLLDKARLSQSLEQAGLALVAENNANRSDKDETTGAVEGHIYLDGTKGDSGKVDYDRRDRDLLKKYVQAYLPDAKIENIENDFKYQCEESTDKDAPRSVICTVEGDIKRVSWLPLNSELSFEPEVNISSGKVQVSKILEPVPLDLMLVTDLTGSMRYPIEGTETTKIESLRNVVDKISNELLENNNENVSPYNRIGFVSFAFGASQTTNKNLCYLPYSLQETKEDLLVEGKQAWEEILSISTLTAEHEKLLEKAQSFIDNFINGIDYEDTVKKIGAFQGKDLPYSLSFNKNAWCLKSENPTETTKKWYKKGNNSTFKTEFNSIEPAGATLSSSGMLIGANLLMDKNDEAVLTKLKTNTQRILLILSDGKDEISKSWPELTITEKLINAGACDAIRTRLDSLQDSNYTSLSSRIHFVAFGYGPEGAQKDAWLKCVGKDKYHEANNEQELLETFRTIVNSSEVGNVIPAY